MFMKIKNSHFSNNMGSVEQYFALFTVKKKLCTIRATIQLIKCRGLGFRVGALVKI
jgi:ureidoglycolate hydrolase